MAKKKITKGKAIAIGVAAVAVIGIALPSSEEPEVMDNNNSPVVQEENVSASPTIIDGEEEVSESVEDEEVLTDDAEPKTEDEIEIKEETTKPEETPVSTPEPVTSTSNETSNTDQMYTTSVSQGKYVGSSDSDKYHKPTCRWAKEILSENIIYFASEEEAVASNYSPCGTCKP